MKKAYYLVLSFLVMVFVIFPCLSCGQSKPGGAIKFGLYQDIGSIDPHKAFPIVERQMASMTCNRLVEPRKDLTVQPGLAESWEISDDGKEYTFRLRQGVRFHNGRELTAQDIKFNMERILDPKTGVQLKPALLLIESIKILDPYKVKLILKKPSASLLAQLFLTYIIAPECVDKDGFITHPIGTGPFELVDWKPKDHLKFKKFKGYWEKGLPYLDEVTVVIAPDRLARHIALRAGDLDIADFLYSNDVEKLRKDPNNKIIYTASPGGAKIAIHFNISKPPLNDIRVRQAVAFAINKQELNLGVLQGNGEAVNQMFVKSSRWYCDVPDRAQDIGKAKVLLKEAGYPSGLDLKVMTLGNIAFRTMCEMLQAQLKKIGINLSIDVFDSPTYYAKLNKTEFMTAVSGYMGVADPDEHYPQLLSPGGARHLVTGKAYDNPKMNELLRKAGEVIDFDKRKALYTEAVKILINDVPIIYVLFEKLPAGWGPHVKGFEPSLTADIVYGNGGLKYTWLEK